MRQGATADRRVARERDADVAREALMNAAERIFAEKGFGGARVDAIAEEARYNKALIFHYFGDKEGLYQAVIARSMSILVAELSQIFLPFADDEEAVVDAARVSAALAASVRLTFDFYRAHPLILRILGWEAASNWSTYAVCAARRNAGTSLKLKQVALIRRAQDVGVIRADIDPAMLVISIIGMTMTHLLSLRRYESILPGIDLTSEAALDTAREQLVLLVLHGALALEHQANDTQPHNAVRAER